MGIHGLTKVIADHAPKAIKENAISQYFGRKIAVDASMSIYQFLIAVRSEGNVLTNQAGETTSHLMGMFYRTIRMMENGIKPIYVFDGKPPSMKSGELDKRLERRKEAEDSLQEAVESGAADLVEKFNRRTVKVTKQHNEECKKLLSLMGVPYVQAPCEAEAQCAALVKSGLAYGTGSEDMDTLTFGSPVLLRHLTFSEARKMPISEFDLAEALEGLNMTMDQFIDLCILLGCDYCDSIKGIGPQKAVKLIQDYGSLENALKNIDAKKYPIPENWPYQEAKSLFMHPEITPTEALSLEIKWSPPQEESIVDFMVREKGFGEDRIRNAVKKLLKTSQTASQGRLDSFFAKTPKRRTDETEENKENPKQAATETKKKESPPKKKATGKKAKWQ